MKIGTKLALGFSFVVIAMLATILFSLNTNTKANKKFEVLADDVVPITITMTKMKGSCHKVAHDVIEYIIGDKEEEKAAAIQEGLKFLEEAAKEHLEYGRRHHPQQQVSAMQLISEVERLGSVCTEIINLKKQGATTNELLKKAENNIHPMITKLLSRLRKCVASHMLELTEAEGAVYQTNIMSERIILSVSFSIIFLSAIIALLTTRSIVRPLHALHKGTEIIGEGNLDYKVATDVKDEIGQLSRAFDQMTQNLKSSMHSICNLDASNQQLRNHKQQLKLINRQLQSEIAERKKVEEALEISNGELKDFVYIASHDLREPLRKISSFGQLLQESLQGKLSDDERENLEFMIDGSDRMTMMIDGLLKYSRANTKEIVFEEVDLNKIVEQLKELELSVLLEETGAVIEIPQPLPKVYADPVQIEQLLQNLIANGIKYRNEEVKPVITIKAQEGSDDKVRIEVQDNGIGISSEFSEEIFKMFKRLHSRGKYEGCGIGLSVCKKIVNRHHGKIGVESEPGKGSTFWFTLSRGKDAVPTEEPVTVSQ